MSRLRDLASAALSYYDLGNPQVVYHDHQTNVLYQVTTESGERYMMRLASPGWRTFTDLYSEAAWLNAIHRDTTIQAPVIIPDRRQRYVLPISIPGIAGVWNTTLMSWVPGRLMGHYLTKYNLEKMGALFTELHHHGATWTPPNGFTTRRFEHWLSRGEDNLIINTHRLGTDNLHSQTINSLTSFQRSILERMHHLVEAAYAALDRSDLRIIHCDL